MKKKCIYKILFLSIFILFALTLSVSAKTMTVDELGEELDKIEEETDTFIDSYYLIGNYVYTSRYVINTRDIMFASRSIDMKNKQEINTENKDSLLSEMTIYNVQRDFMTNGWKILKNYVGDTKLEKSTILDIRYIDYEYVPDDTEIEISLDGINTDKFDSKFTKNADNLVLDGSGSEKKLSGRIELNDQVDSSVLASDRLTKYYFAFKLKVNNEITDKTTVKITYPDGKVDSYTGKGNFDDESQGIMTILAHLDSSKDPKDQIITVEVDLDGGDKYYSTTKYTIDCSEGVVFQKISNDATINIGTPTEADNTKILGWGYVPTLNKNVKLENGILSGTLVEQKLTSAEPFGAGKEDGYYYIFKITMPEKFDTSKLKVTLTDENDEEKTVPETNFDEDGNLTIFKRFEKDTKTCDKCLDPASCEGKCCSGSGECDCNKTLKVKIDYDGDDNDNYLPSEYEIDYCKLIFEKRTDFTISSISEDETAKSKLTEKTSWEVLDDYETNFTLDGANNYKVDGLLPIYTEEVTGITKKSKYYLAMVVTPNEAIKDSTTINFTNSDSVKYIKSDSNDKYYVLISIDPEGDKEFDITIDLDGDGKEYAENTITIDITDLEFQLESKATENIIAEKDSISEGNVTTIEGKWKYDFENIGNDISLVKKDDGNYTLSGKIKQQTLANGVFKENQGYYIPVKICAPTEISSTNWNIQVHDETEVEPKWLTRTPDSEDYSNKYIVVLFKLKEGEGEDKITYKIDWDGDEDKYLPVEVTIDYSGIDYLEEHKVTFKYNSKESSVIVWDDEIIPTDKIPTTEAYAYHEFVYWQKENDLSGAKVDLETETFNTDVTLVPYWKLLADNYITDKLDSLKTDNYDLELTNESNKITVKIKNQDIDLTDIVTSTLTDSIKSILEKEEVESIKFTLGEDSKIFTSSSKDTIETDLKLLFTDKTLDQMLLDSTEIKISIIAKNTVQLKDIEYTINFESDTIVVKNEKDLIKALKINSIKNILIANNIDLTETSVESSLHTLHISIDDPDRKVTIKSKDDGSPITISDKDKTTEGDGDVTPVIQVDKGNVTFENLKIKGATRAISVKSGANVTATNVNAIGSQDTAFDVAEGSTFTGTGLKYTTDGDTNKESYHYPTICGHGTVKITEGASPVNNYTRIVHMKGNTEWTENDFKNPETGEFYPEFIDSDTKKLKDEWQQLIDNHEIRREHSDYLSSTDHTHYYLDSKNTKYYKVHFRDSRVNLIIFKYYGINDEIDPPQDNLYKQSDKDTDFHFFIKAYVDAGKTTAHVHDGWEDKDKNGKKVDKFELSGDPEVAKVYYTRFVDGYRVTLPIKVNGKDKTGVFGIANGTGEMKIKDLITKDPDFAKYYEELKTQASAAGKKIVTTKDHTKEVDDETEISENIDLELIETLQINSVIQSEVSGLSQEGNNLSGTIMTQNDKNEFIIPVTLQSEQFKDGETEVYVTDPNGKTEKYTYSSSSEDGILPASTMNSMKIELNAIKSSLIKDNGKKEYNIKVDIDGEDNDEYAIKNLTINYEQVKTIEEIINEAAENTQNARRLTVTDNSKIRNVNYGYKRIYDKDTGRRYSKYNDGTESYTFPKNTFYESSSDKARIDIDKKKDCNYQGNVDNEYYLNGWRYNNSFSSIGYGISEIELLRDAIKDAKNINAISTVKETGDNTYEIIVSVERFNEWLNTNYADFDYIKSTVQDNYNGTVDSENGIKLTVTLTPQKDGEDRYISSIKSETFTINKDSEINSTDNVIDLTITSVNKDESKVKSLAQIIFGDDADDETYKSQLFEYLEAGKALK